MASAKIILFDSPSKEKKDGTYPVCLKITHQRKRKYFSLGRDSLSKQWNGEACRFRKNYPNHRAENQVLVKIEAKANEIIRSFELDDVPFSLDTFEKKFLKQQKDNTVMAYFSARIESLIEEGKVGSASPHRTTLNALMDFVSSNGQDQRKLKLSDITYKFLVDFEHWLKTVRNCRDTSIGVYMRTLRSVLNRAIKEELIAKDSYPFSQYRLSERLNAQTPKRAIDKSKLKEIEALEFEDGSREQFAQHIFLFIYYTRGMNFIDIAHLTEANIIGNRLFYTRHKTGKAFNINILPKVEEILDYYIRIRPSGSNYIFPIFDDNIHASPEQKYHRKNTVMKQVNKSLKVIAERIGEKGLNLTTYVGRHTYATTLKKSGKSVSLISEAMGHSSEKVTQAYLKSFENSELDEADESLL